MYYFASDVHLGAGDELTSRRTEQRFVAWLDMVAKDAEGIFLMGDIFDFWFEYNNVIPKGFARTLGKLAELSDRGIKITFLTGNHDMWAKDYLFYPAKRRDKRETPVCGSRRQYEYQKSAYSATDKRHVPFSHRQSIVFVAGTPRPCIEIWQVVEWQVKKITLNGSINR